MERTGPLLRLLCLLAASLLLAPGEARAQAYVGAYAGPSFAEDSEVDISSRFLQASEVQGLAAGELISGLRITFSDLEIKTALMAGGRAGVWLDAWGLPYLGLEAEVYGGPPNVNDQTVTMGISRSVNGVPGDAVATFNMAEVDMNVVTVGLNLLGRLPKGPVQPYGGAGLGLVYAQIDNFPNPQTVTVTSDGSTRVLTGGDFASEFNLSGDDVQNLFVRDNDFVPALQLIGGLRVFVLENVALFAEYKRLMTEFEFRDFEMDYDTNQVFGGIEYHFGPAPKEKKPTQP